MSFQRDLGGLVARGALWWSVAWSRFKSFAWFFIQRSWLAVLAYRINWGPGLVCCRSFLLRFQWLMPNWQRYSYHVLHSSNITNRPPLWPEPRATAGILPAWRQKTIHPSCALPTTLSSSRKPEVQLCRQTKKGSGFYIWLTGSRAEEERKMFSAFSLSHQIKGEIRGGKRRPGRWVWVVCPHYHSQGLGGGGCYLFSFAGYIRCQVLQ